MLYDRLKILASTVFYLLFYRGVIGFLLPPNFTPALTFSVDSLRTKISFEPEERGRGELFAYLDELVGPKELVGF